MKEAFKYLITSLPLNIAKPEGALRQGSKAIFRNHLIEEVNAKQTHPPLHSRWIFDGMAAIRAFKPKTKHTQHLCIVFSVL